MNRKIKFETSIEVTDEIINNNAHRARLKVLHDGLNQNNSNVPVEAIEESIATLANKPILAYIERDENGDAIGFGGHESHLEIKEKDGELFVSEFFDEIPIGVIPETHNAKVEEIDGKNYLTCDCLIWKGYSNEAYDMLVENEKNDVSCEMEVKALEFDDDNVMHIKKFNFLGVTVIGVPPGMIGAEIDMNAEFFSQLREKFTKDINDINTYLKQENSGKEDNELEDNKKEFEQTENNTEEGVKEVEDKKVEFGLSIDNLEASIRSQLKDITTTQKNYWGEEYECRSYYLETILPEDKVVILEDYNDWNKHYGVNYSIDGDNVVLDLESKKEYIQEWREKSSTDEVITFEREDVVKDVVMKKFEDLNKELSELKEFKLEYDAKVELEEVTNKVNEVVEKFDFEEEEISELKEKAINKEFTIETFELHLEALYGRKVREQKNEKKNFTKETEKLSVGNPEVEKEDEVKLAFEEMKKKFL
ncbi:hypothetical protein UT300012_32300 [Paraclostridium bifermentans]